MTIACKPTFNWESICNRQSIVLLFSSLILTLGFMSPWYQLPQSTLEVFHTTLALAKILQALVILFAGLSIFSIFWTSYRRAIRLLFWAGLVGGLLFPYLVTTWNPSLAFIASSYYQQGAQVSDHIDRNFSEVQAQWKQGIALDLPEKPSSTFEMSIQDARFFQMSSWDKILLDGLSYNNGALAFIGKGWFFYLSGLVLGLIGFYLALETDGLAFLLQDINRFLPIVFFLFLIIFSSLVGINIFNYKLDTAFAKGNYVQVISESKVLASWYPRLKGDEAFLERLARSEFYTGKVESPLIDLIKGIENYRQENFREAEAFFQASLEADPNNFLARGYLATALLHQGAESLNTPRDRNAATAATYFEKAAQVFPGHVEALYDLMLARTINGEFQASAAIAQKIIEGQQYFQEPKIGLIGQAYVHLAWAEYSQDNTDATWERYRQSIDSQKWDKSSIK
jgi:tetratricopeptide (TPR) repeat protein